LKTKVFSDRLVFEIFTLNFTLTEGKRLYLPSALPQHMGAPAA
jgi:hypothetical protein